MRMSEMIAKSIVALGSSHVQAETDNQSRRQPASYLAHILRGIMHTLATGVPRQMQSLGSIAVDPK
jgi:hypothetical protein